MSSRDDLLSLLLMRLYAADSLRPIYIGEFANHAALPRRRQYPPLFVWIDGDGAIHLDCDRAALARICVIESIRAGQPYALGDVEVQRAVTRFIDLSSRAATETLHANAAALNNLKLKSARSRAAARWGVQA